MKLLGGTYGGKLRPYLVWFLGIVGTFANSRVWRNVGLVSYLDLRGKNDSWSLFVFFFKGSIVSVGDPKKKYTRFEKIGQGLVGAFSFPRKVT